MVRYNFILFLEPHKKSRFYVTLEKYLLATLAHYGLHQGTMLPPHCDMTHFINKRDDYLPVARIVALLDRLVESHSPFNRPEVGQMMPVNNKVVRENALCIPLDLRCEGVGGLVRKPYHVMVKEFCYDASKHCGLNVVPAKMLDIPLVYNSDRMVAKGRRLTRKELQLLWDLAQDIVDFEDARRCAWHCTLYQVRQSGYLDTPHFVVERPVKSWEVSREVVAKKRWEMDWP